MKAIVSVQTFDEGSQLSLVTSCGARVNQVLRSNSTYQQAIMDEWVAEQLASRRLILEIKPDLAKILLRLSWLAGREGFQSLPIDLISEIKHKFPELNNGQRDTDEGSGQSCEAEGAVQKEKVDERRSDGPDQPKERIRLIRNLQTGEEVVAELAYVVKVPTWVNRDALKGLILASEPGGFTDGGDILYFTPSS